MRPRNLMRRTLLISAVTLSPVTVVATSVTAAAAAQTYYVAPNGSDGAAGTLSAP